MAAVESRSRFPRMLLLSAGTFAIAVVGLSAGLAALRPIAHGPNVVLIVMDTARADRLSVYGYPHSTSPHLGALAVESTLYLNAYSTSSWTSPSHASLFSGLHPRAHGVTQEFWSTSNDVTTLAEILRDHGYRTAATVGNGMLSRYFGFDQGFESDHEVWRDNAAPQAEHSSIRFLREFVRSEKNQAFFAFLNFIEPHNPYDSSPHRFRTRGGA